MTTLLEKAFAEAQKLPPEEQESLGQLILDELASEERWTKAFEQSQDALAKLAGDAIKEFRAGRVQPLDINRL